MPLEPPEFPFIRPDFASGLADLGKLSSTAADLLGDTETLADYFDAVKAVGLFADLVVALANGMTREKALSWAVEAGKIVIDKLPAAEAEALGAVEEALAVPASAQQSLAGSFQEMASSSGLQGPGGWAAQAAAWAFGASEEEDTATEALFGMAVEAAIKLSAALTANDWPLAPSPDDLASATTSGASGEAPSEHPTPPAEPSPPDAPDEESPTQALNRLLEPFVEIGLKIAADQWPPAA